MTKEQAREVVERLSWRKTQTIAGCDVVELANLLQEIERLMAEIERLRLQLQHARMDIKEDSDG